MGRIDNLKSDQLGAVVGRVRRVETTNSLDSGSVDNGHTTYRGNESLRVIGSALVSGWLIITGTLKVVGTLLIEGVTTLTGPLNVNGGWGINGNGGINGTQTNTGALTQNGPWTMNGAGTIAGNVTQTGNYTLSGSGKIIAGTGMFFGPTARGPGLEFDDGSTVSKRTYGVAMAFTDTSYVSVNALGPVLKYGSFSLGVNALGTGVTGGLAVSGAFTAASKSFKIPHPLKDNTWLLHGVTESPVHGVEYWGEETIGADGSFRVELPDYFEALTLEEGRAVLVTGRGHCPDWSDIDGTHFIVTGEPGKRFSWLVKAARSDVILETEEPVEPVTGL